MVGSFRVSHAAASSNDQWKARSPRSMRSPVGDYAAGQLFACVSLCVCGLTMRLLICLPASAEPRTGEAIGDAASAESVVCVSR